MKFLVVNLSASGMPANADGTFATFTDRKDYIKDFATTLEAATVEAERQAKKNPGVLYAVMSVAKIVEALPPAEPKLVRKIINNVGEIVLDQ